ncbi:hypothetical protein MK805_14830 [Shimazuella sp. AN120528]|uniref:hypothetical protein n=1 Tax=Shimazuella soli TaxID=1892854 RepID=UPI001F0FBC77|nr:hypothetical protein [Shimazuella soli]MCH5586215.1 hypothetical protein [Shimazuella soli]
MSGFKTPTTYSDWITSFQIFRDAHHDEELLETIATGKVPWTKGVAERFTQKMGEAVSDRLQKAVNQFTKELGRVHGNENAMVQAILAFRRQINYLIRFVSVTVFPEELRNKMNEELKKNVKEIQSYLLDEAKKEPSGRLLRIIQQTPIWVNQPQDNPSPIPMGKTKRRIIFE